MASYKFSLAVLVLCLAVTVFCNTAVKRSKRRVHIPWLGIGPRCSGCPPRFCDDDHAVIYGYCCGCASVFDVLPVRCPVYLDCPLNGNGLCEDYEYMMHCCCE